MSYVDLHYSLVKDIYKIMQNSKIIDKQKFKIYIIIMHKNQYCTMSEEGIKSVHPVEMSENILRFIYLYCWFYLFHPRTMNYYPGAILM